MLPGPISSRARSIRPSRPSALSARLTISRLGEAIAERARSLRIVVEETNQQARSFYRRSGFVPVEPELFELILPSPD